MCCIHQLRPQLHQQSQQDSGLDDRQRAGQWQSTMCRMFQQQLPGFRHCRQDTCLLKPPAPLEWLLLLLLLLLLACLLAGFMPGSPLGFTVITLALNNTLFLASVVLLARCGVLPC